MQGNTKFEEDINCELKKKFGLSVALRKQSEVCYF